MPELTKLHRELISRGTLLILALLLFYGAYRCIRAGYAWQAEFDAKYPEYAGREERGTSGALIAYVGGGMLLIAGGFLGFMGLASPERFEALWAPRIPASGIGMTDNKQVGHPLLRYVVLRHEGIPDPHFDLMFETSPGSMLATWRAPQWPVEPDAPLTHLSDHRATYLTYEGPLSDNRGTVRRIESGHHRVEQNDVFWLVVVLNSGERLSLPRA